MVWRRVSLLLVGSAGGLLFAAVLYVSAIEGWHIRVTEFNSEKSVHLNEKKVEEIIDISENTMFPNMIPGTSLLAERLAVYEGPFLEDGSDREVADVAALVVQNTGKNEIISCCVEICLGEISYIFFGERIPPGATALLVESRGAKFQLGSVQSWVGWQIIDADKQNFTELVTVEERAMGTLVVTNISNRTLNEICIYYKNWLSPPDILVGGIAYSISIPQLLPGQTEILYPYHFVCGYSKIVSLISK